jgi:3-hydroxypropanoate dehydrogenase
MAQTEPATAPKQPVSLDARKQLFLEGRSLHAFLPQPVSDETLQQLYELTKFGPTAFNAQPARYLFLRSPEAKGRMAKALSGGNKDKTLAAPVSVIVAWDSQFYEHLPTQFPGYDAKSFFVRTPESVEPTAKLNATLQAGYFIIAARSLGLDAGPLSGFKPELIDSEFFADGRFKSLLVINLGYGDRSHLRARAPRLAYALVASVL